MKVIECDFPAGSLKDRRMVNAAYYRDSFGAPICNPQASVTDIFHAIFAHRPIWMRALFMILKRVVALWGLHAEAASASVSASKKQHLA